MVTPFFRLLLDWWAGKPAVRRHPQWGRESVAWLRHNPACCVCGGRATVVHHRLPFHLWPEYEMTPLLPVSLGLADRQQWMAVCEGERHRSLHCHLLLHGGNFRSYVLDAPLLATRTRQALAGKLTTRF